MRIYEHAQKPTLKVKGKHNDSLAKQLAALLLCWLILDLCLFPDLASGSRLGTSSPDWIDLHSWPQPGFCLLLQYLVCFCLELRLQHYPVQFSPCLHIKGSWTRDTRDVISSTQSHSSYLTNWLVLHHFSCCCIGQLANIRIMTSNKFQYIIPTFIYGKSVPKLSPMVPHRRTTFLPQLNWLGVLLLLKMGKLSSTHGKNTQIRGPNLGQ